MRVSGSLADDVERCALPFGYLSDVVNIFLVDEEAHAFLALVGDDFLAGKRLVADGEFRHVDNAAAVLNEFGEAVDVSGGAVVVDADNGVDVLLAEGSYEVVGAFLHFRVGALHGIQFDAIGVSSGINGGDGAAAEADAVVVATYDNNFVALLGLLLEAVALGAVTDAAGEHYDLVVGIFLVALLVLESEYRAADEGLTELVAEVGCPVGGLDEDLFRCLVEPFSDGQEAFPNAEVLIVIFFTVG